MRPALLAGLTLVGLVGCLERTTGEPESLDPRFTAGATEAGTALVTHDPDAGPGNPFGLGAGQGVTVRGSLTSPVEGSISLDILAIDPTSEAGVSMVARMLFPEAGPFSIQIPEDRGELTLQFFVDQGPPGPDDGDPFAARDIHVKEVDLDLAELPLVVGGRALAPVPGARSHVFPDHPGPWTRIQGQINATSTTPVAVDLRRPDPNSQTGDAFVGKEQLAGPGPFTLMVPQDQGPLTLQFFQDAGGDGPSADDPFAELKIEVGDQERIPVEVTLTAEQDAPATPQAPTPEPKD